MTQGDAAGVRPVPSARLPNRSAVSMAVRSRQARSGARRCGSAARCDRTSRRSTGPSSVGGHGLQVRGRDRSSEPEGRQQMIDGNGYLHGAIGGSGMARSVVLCSGAKERATCTIHFGSSRTCKSACACSVPIERQADRRK